MATMKTVIYVGIAVAYGNPTVCHVAVSHSDDDFRQHAVCGILGSEGHRLCAFDDHLEPSWDCVSISLSYRKEELSTSVTCSADSTSDFCAIRRLEDGRLVADNLEQGYCIDHIWAKTSGMSICGHPNDPCAFQVSQIGTSQTPASVEEVYGCNADQYKMVDDNTVTCIDLQNVAYCRIYSDGYHIVSQKLDKTAQLDARVASEHQIVEGSLGEVHDDMEMLMDALPGANDHCLLTVEAAWKALGQYKAAAEFGG